MRANQVDVLEERRMAEVRELSRRCQSTDDELRLRYVAPGDVRPAATPVHMSGRDILGFPTPAPPKRRRRRVLTPENLAAIEQLAAVGVRRGVVAVDPLDDDGDDDRITREHMEDLRRVDRKLRKATIAAALEEGRAPPLRRKESRGSHHQASEYYSEHTSADGDSGDDADDYGAW